MTCAIFAIRSLGIRLGRQNSHEFPAPKSASDFFIKKMVFWIFVNKKNIWISYDLCNSATRSPTIRLGRPNRQKISAPKLALDSFI